MRVNLSYFYSLIFCMLLLACSSGSQAQVDPCYINDPLEELGWLRDIVQRYNASQMEQKADIYQYSYRGQKIFLADMCVGCPDYLTIAYDCTGNIICEFGGITGKDTCPDFQEKAISKVLLWSSWQQ